MESLHFAKEPSDREQQHGRAERVRRQPVVEALAVDAPYPTAQNSYLSATQASAKLASTRHTHISGSRRSWIRMSGAHRSKQE